MLPGCPPTATKRRCGARRDTNSSPTSFWPPAHDAIESGSRPDFWEETMASVAIRDVRKAFGTTRVIHGVDISIDDGEFVVLVGPSGCGKSTLLRMIAGLENITGGEIRIGE